MPYPIYPVEAPEFVMKNLKKAEGHITRNIVSIKRKDGVVDEAVMINRIRKIYPSPLGLNEKFSSWFSRGSWVGHETPEEGRILFIHELDIHGL